MYGTFVPVTTGHLPIDFRQQIKYNCFNRQINKNPSPFGEGLFTSCGEGGYPLSSLYDPPKHSLPDFIIILVNLSKCQVSATEIVKFAVDDLTS